MPPTTPEAAQNAAPEANHKLPPSLLFPAAHKDQLIDNANRFNNAGRFNQAVAADSAPAAGAVEMLAPTVAAAGKAKVAADLVENCDLSVAKGNL